MRVLAVARNVRRVNSNLCRNWGLYANDYVVSGLPFMSATATRIEIATFGLRRGDVMIEALPDCLAARGRSLRRA